MASSVTQVVAQLLGVPGGCECVGARDSEGLTPLHCAAQQGSAAIVSRLLHVSDVVSLHVFLGQGLSQLAVGP